MLLQFDLPEARFDHVSHADDRSANKFQIFCQELGILKDKETDGGQA